MKDTNKNIDRLFEQARHLPPLISKGIITHTPQKQSHNLKKGIYAFIGIILLSVTTYYLLSDKTIEKQSASGNDKQKQYTKIKNPVTTQGTIQTKKETNSTNKPLKEQDVIEKKDAIDKQHSKPTAQLIPPMVTDSIPYTGKRDTITIKTIIEDKSEFISDFIVIHRFFGEDELNRVCKKLLAVGIDLRIEKKEFSSKNKGVLSFLKADIFIGGQLYKHINLRDFSEIHIGWEKQGNHAVIIKSLAYVDKNYVKRKL